MKTGKTLRTALSENSFLRPSVKDGMQAVESSHRSLIQESERRRVGDSLDLDEATRSKYPNDNRWDYIISIPDADKLVGIEPHSMIDSQIDTVILKKKGSKTVLDQELRPGIKNIGVDLGSKRGLRIESHG